ncbi:MAG: DUF4345 family protein [Pseudomonadales bacterium]|nr:DUF4345 family protein [Pseudomonadales bacterium]
MKTTYIPVYLRIIGWLFAGFGIAYVFFPTLLLEQSGMLTPSAAAQADVYAMYAGLQIGFGLWLLACAKHKDLQPAGLLSIVFIFGGIAAGRTLGVLYYASYDAFNISALCIEWPGSLFALYLYNQNRKASPAS